jgi:hypothetical protein
MKDVLLLHDNAKPRISLRTSVKIAKMGRTARHHPAHSPDLAPSYCHLFGPHVKDALGAGHFEDENKMKRSFPDVLRSQVREFYNTVIYSVLLNGGKSVLKTKGDFAEKQPHNSERCMNHPCKFHCYCNYTSWKKWTHYFSTTPR